MLYNALRRGAQVFLGFVFTFMALVLLIVGIIRIWVWFDGNMAGRSFNYQKTRIYAGTAKNVPLEVVNKPFALDKDWVFKGRADGSSFTPVTPIELAVPTGNVQECCTDCCSGDKVGISDCSASGCKASGCSCAPLPSGQSWPPDPKGTPYTDDVASCIVPVMNSDGKQATIPVVDSFGNPVLDSQGDPETTPETQYDPTCLCHERCLCRAEADQHVNALLQEACMYVGDTTYSNGQCDAQHMSALQAFSETVDNQSNSNFDAFKTHLNAGQVGALMNEAGQLRNKANDCDDPWEICWWGGFGKTADELNDAAQGMEDMAHQMYDRAVRLVGNGQGGYVGAFYGCCEKSTKVDMDLCTVNLALALNNCYDMYSTYRDRWNQESNSYLSDVSWSELKREEVFSVAQSCHEAAEAYCRLKWMTQKAIDDTTQYMKDHLTGFNGFGCGPDTVFGKPSITPIYITSDDCNSATGDPSKAKYHRDGLQVYMDFNGGNTTMTPSAYRSTWNFPKWQIYATVGQAWLGSSSWGGAGTFTAFYDMMPGLQKLASTTLGGNLDGLPTSSDLFTMLKDADHDVLTNDTQWCLKHAYCVGDECLGCTPCTPNADDIACQNGTAPCKGCNGNNCGCALQQGPIALAYLSCLPERSSYCCESYGSGTMAPGNDHFLESFDTNADTQVLADENAGVAMTPGPTAMTGGTGQGHDCYQAYQQSDGTWVGALAPNNYQAVDARALDAKDNFGDQASADPVVQAMWHVEWFLNHYHRADSYGIFPYGVRPWTLGYYYHVDNSGTTGKQAFYFRGATLPGVLANQSVPIEAGSSDSSDAYASQTAATAYNQQSLYDRYLYDRDDAIYRTEVFDEINNPAEDGGSNQTRACGACYHAENYAGTCCACSGRNNDATAPLECDAEEQAGDWSNGCSAYAGSSSVYQACIARQKSHGLNCDDLEGCADSDIPCKTTLLACKQALVKNRVSCMQDHDRHAQRADLTNDTYNWGYYNGPAFNSYSVGDYTATSQNCEGTNNQTTLTPFTSVDGLADSDLADEPWGN